MYCAFEKSKRDRVMRTERLAMSKISKSKRQKIPQVVSRFTQRFCVCESDDRCISNAELKLSLTRGRRHRQQAAHEFADQRIGPHGFRERAIAQLQRAEACSLRREIAGNQTALTTGPVDYGRHTAAAFDPSRAAVRPASPTRADL